MMKQIPVLFALLCMVRPAVGQSTPTAYTNARIIPISGTPIERGDILIADGKIKAIGSAIVIPASAVKIDLHGATIIPGLIDASSALFLTPETISGAGTADQNVLDGIDPFDKAAVKVLARGITTVYISPGNRGNVGGLGAVVKLQDGVRGVSQSGAAVFETPLKAKAGLELALGLSVNGKSTSLDRMASYESLRSMFVGAQQYVRQQARAEQAKKTAAAAPAAVSDEPAVSRLEADEFDPDQAQRRQFGRGRGGAGGPAAPLRAQPAQETLAAALKGEIPVRIEAHRIDNILNALRLADEFKFKLVLEAPTEAASIASEIASHHASVVWTPVAPDGPPQLETKHFNPYTIASLGAARIPLAISARSSAGAASRFLLENAEMAAGSGLKPDAALRAVTLGAAEILGVEDRIGSLSAGKDADFVVLSGSPWDSNSIVKRVVINGIRAYAAP